jgi:Domain of unknown function (DUF4082)/Fibronectin type III domain/Bacterial Ig domain
MIEMHSARDHGCDSATSRRIGQAWLVALVAVAAMVLVSVQASPAAAAGPCGPPVVSVIACENTQQGDPPSDWQVNGSGDSTIQGFATSISVDVGGTVQFKIKTPASSYHIDILRMGYYQGNGARKLVLAMRPTATLPQSQPACLTGAPQTGLIDCGNWAVSASWTVPSTFVSGVYLAHLVRDDTRGSSLIPFVVRNDASRSDMILQTSDETWQAYNTYGGNSLYTCADNCPPASNASYTGASKVSYNRPFHSADDDLGRSWVMYAEYPMIRFLEANGYDVSYTSGIDVGTSAGGALLSNHKTFMSVGHDEYWSASQRANVEAARDKGVNLAFFSGNEVFWKTRTEPSIDGSGTANRTLVCYKETHYDGVTDPQDPPTWTGTWQDPRFSPPGDGGRPQNALTGQLFVVNSGTTDINVPAQYAKLRLWRNTDVATLTPGDSQTLGQGLGTLGYEWDEDADNGSRPAGLFDLSSTTSTSAEVFTDYGSTTKLNSTATHHLTLYRAASGALVFGAGTVQWSWGLDNPNGQNPDPNMQQATVNLFADMGVQPYALMAGLVLATASTDTTAPTSRITSPAPSATVSDGAKITVAGTAADTGGGVVAGVEVSTDGGATWHPATGTTSWSYSWVAHGNPTTTIKTRAVDDSGNVETPSAGVTVSVGCSCSIFGTGATPGLTDSGSSSAVEVGVKFTSDVSGTVTGLRFYKASTNTGTHIGNLWTASGTKLASATFTGETASGWQQVVFASPVSITAKTTYVASYFAPSGHTAQGEAYFYPHPSPQPDGNGSVDSPPLHALRNTNGTVNGVYLNSSASAFPTNSTNARNYWVDVVFAPRTGAATAPGAPTGVTATPGNAAAALNWTVPADNGSAITSYTVTPYIGTTAQTATTVTGSPPATSATISGLTNGTTYTFTVSATNGVGTGPASAASNAVTPSATSCIVCTIWPSSATPVSPSNADTSSVEVGVKFTADTNGSITGIRFYKGASNIGTHIGDLWTASGTRLASVTFTSETGSGWQQASFATSVPITAGTVYVASYLAPSGHYAADTNAFATSGVDAPPLHALKDGVSGGNGVYAYGTTSTFPNNSFASSNYWVDVVFSTGPASTPAAPTNVSATAGNASATVQWTAPTDGGSPITTYTVTPYIGATAQTPTAVTGTPPATSATVSGLTNGTSYTFTVTATNAVGSGPASAASVAVTPKAPTIPAAPTGVLARAGNASAVVSWTAPSDGSSAITSYTVTPFIGSTAQTATTVTGSPPATSVTVTGLTNGTTYTFTVSATNGVGTGPASSPSSPITPSTASCAACTLWSSSDAPTTASANDTFSVEVGVKFTSDVSGSVTGIRFYKGTGNTGTHVGNLWTASGTKLASVTFTNETASGWQQVNFPTPVAITAGTVYVASYLAPAGRYAADGGYFAGAGVDNGPLHALKDGASGGDGVFAYSSTSTFPGNTYNSTNYWVDVVFAGSVSSPAAPTSVTVTPGDGHALVKWTAPATGGSAITSYTVTPYVGSTAQVATTVSGNPPATSATIAGLTNGTSYTFTVSATNAVGTGPTSSPSAPVTPSGTSCAVCTIWPASATPTNPSTADGSPVQLGVKFTSDRAGSVTAIRFYKGSGNTGTHVGSLWTASGTLLVSATFTNETPSGWQQVTFATPVAVTAGTVYVASYYAPVGHYAADGGAFASAGVDNSPLHALRDGTSGGDGVYAYGGSTTFPSNSFNSTNYWVDVVFSG